MVGVNYILKKYSRRLRYIKLMCLASSCEADELAQTVAAMTAYFPENSYDIELVDGGLCLHPTQRAQRLIELFESPYCDVVWALRGGCGSADCLPELYQQLPRLRRCLPKLLVGFSDITALLLFFSKHLGWPVWHAPVVRDVWRQRIDPVSIQQIIDVLTQQDISVQMPLQALNAAAKVPGCLTVPVTGGNLCMVALSIKDYNEINTQGHVVILEDVNEAPYAVGRTLAYLTRIGQFSCACAVVLGDFSGPDSDLLKMNKVLKNFAQAQSIPVFSCDQFGHGPLNTPIPFSIPITIQTGPNAKLIWTMPY